MKKLISCLLSLIVWGWAGHATALLQLSPPGFNFGSVKVGETATQAFTVTNKDSQLYDDIDVTISSISIGIGSRGFKIASESCPNVLSVGASCTITVSFNPSDTSETKRDNLEIVTKEEGTFSVFLAGWGQASLLSFSRDTIDFQDVYLNQAVSETIQVINNMDYPINLTVSSSQVFQTSHNCSPLSSKGYCSITITFRPTSTSKVYRTIDVSWNDGAKSIYVQGTGVTDDDHRDNVEGGGGGGCFIATTSDRPLYHAYVRILRGFRDRFLSIIMTCLTLAK